MKNMQYVLCKVGRVGEVKGSKSESQKIREEQKIHGSITVNSKKLLENKISSIKEY